jgi:predicted regulator of Ras-like GTPase activity (Roadblock/LC7/MglB family)
VKLLIETEEIVGAVVWRDGDVPIGSWKEEAQDDLGSSLLAALMENLEKGVKDLGLGQISQIWWQTQDAQCLGFRAGEWEVLVFADAVANLGKLRTGVAKVLDENWILLDHIEE